MIDFVIEFLCDLLCDGCSEAAKSPKLPKWLRMLLISIPFVAVEIIFVLMLISGIQDKELALTLLSIGLIVLVLAAWLYLLYKIQKNKPFHD